LAGWLFERWGGAECGPSNVETYFSVVCFTSSPHSPPSPVLVRLFLGILRVDGTRTSEVASASRTYLGRTQSRRGILGGVGRSSICFAVGIAIPPLLVGHRCGAAVGRVALGVLAHGRGLFPAGGRVWVPSLFFVKARLCARQN